MAKFEEANNYRITNDRLYLGIDEPVVVKATVWRGDTKPGDEELGIATEACGPDARDHDPCLLRCASSLRIEQRRKRIGWRTVGVALMPERPLNQG